MNIHAYSKHGDNPKTCSILLLLCIVVSASTWSLLFYFWLFFNLITKNKQNSSMVRVAKLLEIHFCWVVVQSLCSLLLDMNDCMMQQHISEPCFFQCFIYHAIIWCSAAPPGCGLGVESCGRWPYSDINISFHYIGIQREVLAAEEAGSVSAAIIILYSLQKWTQKDQQKPNVSGRRPDYHMIIILIIMLIVCGRPTFLKAHPQHRVCSLFFL